jgi:two-component system nitrogen regulation response regulator NtrX
MNMVLIVDDVAAMREQYAYDLKRLAGFETITASGGAEAIQILETEPVDCMILDLEMPGVDGFEVLKTMQSRRSRVPVIVYTGTDNYDRCVRAIKLGAYSFLAKAEPLERVVREVENALSWRRLNRTVASLRHRSGEDAPLVGESRAMRELSEQVQKLAPIPSPVLIIGESGSGKELVARQLHVRSERAGADFVAVNCAALPENLTESELFGHERGAFTGAERTRKGAFEQSTRGTLFLDEIGELPLSAQAKLLRVLEEGQVTRVGSSRAINVDARVLAATNRDLNAEVSVGRFREDLLYRLNVHVLRVPPLRERLSDVPLLVEHFLRAIAERFGQKTKVAHPDTLVLLQQYDWSRNNVRELRNVVERLVISCPGDFVLPDHLPADFQVRVPEVPGEASEPAAALTSFLNRPGNLKDLKSAAERQIILAALDRNDWHVTRTAAELGLADHSSLLKIMRRHGLKRPRKPGG